MDVESFKIMIGLSEASMLVERHKFMKVESRFTCQSPELILKNVMDVIFV